MHLDAVGDKSHRLPLATGNSEWNQNGIAVGATTAGGLPTE
nr:MAG TPA: hypothetical protein [Caudoviricetes sp.]